MKIPESMLLQTGLPLEYVVKELKIQELLARLSSRFNAEGITYAFFGGTALNQFYLKAKRFSEDLDFFVYGSTPKKLSIFLKKNAQGFQASRPERVFGEFYRWKLAYSDEENGIGKDYVFLDGQFKYRTPSSPLVSLEPKSFLNEYGFFIRTPLLQTFPVEAFAAQKMVALHARTLGKDYYDVHRLLRQYALSKKRVLPQARVYAKSLFEFMPFNEKTFFQETAKKVGEADPKELAAADPFIPLPHRPNWLQLQKELERMLSKLR